MVRVLVANGQATPRSPQGGQFARNSASYRESRIARRIPDVVSSARQCGWRCQDAKHVIARIALAITKSCTKRRGRTHNDIDRKRVTYSGQMGLLSQFWLAKEQTDRAESRLRDGNDNEETAPERE